MTVKKIDHLVCSSRQEKKKKKERKKTKALLFTYESVSLPIHSQSYENCSRSF